MRQLILVPTLWSNTCCKLTYKLKTSPPPCVVIKAVIKPTYIRTPKASGTIILRQKKERKETITNSLVQLGRAKPAHLAFLSKVVCEFFQFFQVLLIDRWLRVCQRPQHVRLEKGREGEAVRAGEDSALLSGHRTVALPCSQPAPAASPQAHPSMSSQRRWGLRASTESRGHRL